MPKHARLPMDCFANVSQCPPSADGAMATGAAPMRPKAGLIRDLLEGSFPELYPPPEPEPEPEEVEPAEPDAEAEAEASDDAPEPEPPADPEPEPEEGAGEAPPEDDAERLSNPELDAYQKRMAEIDAKVRARAGPNLGRNHRSNRTFQKRVPFFFFVRTRRTNRGLRHLPTLRRPPDRFDPTPPARPGTRHPQKTKSSLRLLRGWSA